MGLFKLKNTKIEGCYEILNTPFLDSRGGLVKVYHFEQFQQLNLCSAYEESYYSVSERNVLRGLHFQSPPYDSVKLVTCLSGSIMDVVVDLRKTSKTYGEYFAVELNDKNRTSLYVPPGLAHGFLATSENAIFLSYNSKKYNADSEGGIRWDSIGYDWKEINPRLSDKDRSLPLLKDFDSPFI